MSNVVNFHREPSDDYVNGRSLAIDAFMAIKEVGYEEASRNAINVVMEVLSDKDTDTRDFLAGYISMLLDVIGGESAA